MPAVVELQITETYMLTFVGLGSFFKSDFVFGYNGLLKGCEFCRALCIAKVAGSASTIYIL